ncbi:hypothetical protein EOD41_13585 [Mucilaginibacter limnophilus]|uniref:DUF4412 domain-containing protein n=1 Tax=Mucilaginibacter limnophilus TaxID=1932778 RepID=A0A437MQU1_9SPHI|nr:hypothetical protein [Mucilaginibacter limnophilus]RVT99992.1 hypothetical protein EOD41_13585 [Mucilaginibacter limnophilus]
MKRTLITLAFIIACIVTYAQSFEGYIVYKNSYKSKTDNLSDSMMTAMMGDTQKWYTKGGEYKSEINGTFMQWQIYNKADNKLYTKIATSNDALFNYADVNTDEIQNVQLNKGVTEVLGYKCDELILTCKSGIQKYYFSSKLPLDSKLFEKHKYGNWYEFLNRTNAVPLKIILDNPQLSLESVATEIKKVPLDKNLFVLPAGMNATINPY